MKKPAWIGIGLILAAVPLSILVGAAHNSEPAEKWAARYNGPGNGDDGAQALAVDKSGNIYVTGESLGKGTGLDFATVKYSSQGKQLWAKRYDGPAHGDDRATGIAVDGSGNIFVLGESEGSGTGSDITTIKYNANGKQLWVKRHNGLRNDDDETGGIAVDGSDNVYVTGKIWDSSFAPYFITIKYNPKGNRLWAKNYTDPNNDNNIFYGEAHAIAVDGSGNAHITGSIRAGGYDIGTVKFDASGQQLWARTYNGPGDGSDTGMAVAVDGSGNVYIAGRIYSSSTDYDWVTVKYNANGKRLWAKRFSGSGSYADCPEAIAVDGSGNAYVTGWRRVSWGECDYVTIKYGPGGQQIWARRYTGPIGYDLAVAIAVDGSGNIYVTGESRNSRNNPDYATVKYDTNGKELWVKRYEGPDRRDNYAKAIAIDTTGNVYITGYSKALSTGYDFATLKY